MTIWAGQRNDFSSVSAETARNLPGSETKVLLGHGHVVCKNGEIVHGSVWDWTEVDR